MLLEYQVGVTGENNLLNGLRSIEKETAASYQRALTREKSFENSRVRLSQRGAQQVANAEEKERLRALRSKEREEERSRTRKVREEQRAADKIRRYEERQYQGVLNYRNRMADKARREVEKRDRLALAARRTTAARVQAGAGRVFSGVAGAVGGGIRTLSTLGGVFGSLAVGNAVRVRMDEQALATQLSNQASDKADPELRNKLLNEAQGVRGFSGGEVLNSLNEFVAKTGDLEAARGIIQDLGQLSLATGADIADLGATAGQAFNVLKDQISDPKQQLIELRSLMAALAQQGAMGAVEIRDLARDFGKLGAATRAFEGGAPALLRSMGAFAQLAVARGGAEGSADASTAAARLANDIVVNKKKFKAIGVGIQSKTDATKLRDPLSIMLDVLDKTKGSVTKTTGLFGQESAKIFRSLAAVYSEAEKRQKGSGRSAVQTEFNRFMGAELSPEVIQGKADLRAADPDVQFTEAVKAFNAELGSRLLPKLTELIPKIAELTPAVVSLTESAIKAAEWLAENPFTGASAIVGAFIVKELAAVGFSSLFQKAIMRLGGGGPGVDVDVPIGGTGRGARAARGAAKAGRLGRIGGALGRLGTAGAIAVGSFAVGAIAADMYSESETGQKNIQANAQAAQNHYGVGVYSGAVPKEYQQQLQDPAFLASVNKITAGQPKEPVNAPSSFDPSKMEALTQKQMQAFDALNRATASLERTSENLKQSQARSTPILMRTQ